MAEAGWPVGRALVLAAPAPFEGIARLVAEDIRSTLGLEVEIAIVPDEGVLAGSRSWSRRSSSRPGNPAARLVRPQLRGAAAAVHREFFGVDGAFRAGPEIPAFDALMAEMIARSTASGSSRSPSGSTATATTSATRCTSARRRR
jgi:peptide/nickel transport system substrate-binding protein